VLAAVLDGLDGAVARLTHTQSRFGLEFDSLSDLVSFGVAPSLAAFMMLDPSDRDYTRLLTAVCALYAVCGALRLARYNVQAGGPERKGFLGMPIPGAALAIISTVLLLEHYNLSAHNMTWLPFVGDQISYKVVLQAFFPFLLLALALLMVSEVPYPSIAKQIHIQRHMSFASLVSILLVAIPILALGSDDRIAVLFVLAYGYTFFGLSMYLYKILKKGKRGEKQNA
jgi:CDP-diacylglycerol---serine O-phosphatidyltransferase